MAAATGLARQTPGNDWAPIRVKRELHRLLAWCGVNNGQPNMLFRVGHAEAPGAATARKPVDSYLD